MNLVDNNGVGQGTCANSCTETAPVLVDPSFQPSGGWPVELGGDETMELGLNVDYCYTAPGQTEAPCNLIWMDGDGLDRATHLASAEPGQLTIHAVVVLANIRAAFGGSHHEVGTNQTPVLVMGLPMNPTNFASGSLVSLPDSTYQLLAHELGHGLGLLDEYTDEINMEVSFDGTRNVWFPGVAPGAWGQTTPHPLPWQPLLEGCPLPLIDCDFHDGQSVSSATARCSYVTHATLSIPSPFAHHPACQASRIWEGGFYHEKYYFTSDDECRMRTNNSEFCAVCTQLLHEGLSPYPASTCLSGGP